jgi:hypothetical protein
METEIRTSAEPNCRIRDFRLCDIWNVMYWYSCREHLRCYRGPVVVSGRMTLCFCIRTLKNSNGITQSLLHSGVECVLPMDDFRYSARQTAH